MQQESDDEGEVKSVERHSSRNMMIASSVKISHYSEAASASSYGKNWHQENKM